MKHGKRGTGLLWDASEGFAKTLEGRKPPRDGSAEEAFFDLDFSRIEYIGYVPWEWPFHDGNSDSSFIPDGFY